MPDYPRLATGSLAQYPIVKKRITRTLTNLMPGGEVIKAADDGASVVQWTLEYSGLTDDERSALDSFFQASEGRLKGFTFLDPAGNLFAFSETLDQPVWEKDPQLNIQGGAGDPLGTQRATAVRAPSAAPQAIQQTLALPAQVPYTLSVYARSSTPTELTLFVGADRAVERVYDAWTRLALTAEPADTSSPIASGIEFSANASVSIFGFQLEPQISASGYRQSASTAGIYPDARFDMDAIQFVAQDSNRHSCTVRIIHANHL